MRAQNEKGNGRLLPLPLFLSLALRARVSRLQISLPLSAPATQAPFGWNTHTNARLVTTGGKRDFGCQRLRRYNNNNNNNNNSNNNNNNNNNDNDNDNDTCLITILMEEAPAFGSTLKAIMSTKSYSSRNAIYSNQAPDTVKKETTKSEVPYLKFGQRQCANHSEITY